MHTPSSLVLLWNEICKMVPSIILLFKKKTGEGYASVTVYAITEALWIPFQVL